MKPVTFKANRTFTGQFPLNVTRAANTLTAIANRNDTPYVIALEIAGAPPRPCNHIVPLARAVVAKILGPEIAGDFAEAMANHAAHEYFARVSDRLFDSGIVLAYTREGWFLMKIPGFLNLNRTEKVAYGVAELEAQSPNGFNGVDFNTVKSLPSSIDIHTEEPFLRLNEIQGTRVFCNVRDVVDYSVKMINVRLHPSYETADQVIKDRWEKEVKGILYVVKDGYFPPNSPFSKDLLNTIRDTFDVQRFFEMGDVRLTPETVSHVWETTLDKLEKALECLDNADPI